MTTKITIDAHAGWDVLVTFRTKHHVDKNASSFYGVTGSHVWMEHNETVPANTIRDIYIHDSMYISGIQEIHKP